MQLQMLYVPRSLFVSSPAALYACANILTGMPAATKTEMLSFCTLLWPVSRFSHWTKSSFCAEPEGLLAKARAAVTSVVSSLGFGLPGSDNVPSDGQNIKDTYWQYHNELTSLESRDTELKTQLSQDYGPNGEFLTLRDR